jgi:phospholipid/cholesterol/gamma-HCH transport system ATP-binding protein
MNSVLEIGDNIMFIYKGDKHWEGSKHAILKTADKEVNDFVYATQFMKEMKTKL